MRGVRLCTGRESMTRDTDERLRPGGGHRPRLRHPGRGGPHPPAHRRGALARRAEPARAALRLALRLPRREPPGPGRAVPALGLGHGRAAAGALRQALSPVQCIVNEYRPGQGIGMHADHADFGPVVASLSLADDWPMQFRRRTVRPYARDALPGDEVAVLPRRSVLVLAGPARTAWMHGIDRDAGRAPRCHPHLGDLPDAGFRRRSSVSPAQPVFLDLPPPGVAP